MSGIKRPVSPDVSEPAAGLWSNCLVADGIAYLSGMTARDKSMQAVGGLDEYQQAKIIFGKLRGMVEAAGGAMADVVKLTIFVTDISKRELVWQARREFFTGDFPACSLVQVAALADPAINVEIEGVAHIGASRA